MSSRFAVASDAGGTMTDIFIVDQDGKFSVGKAPTTKFDESIGFMEALEDAFFTWDMDFRGDAKALTSRFDNVVYAGTSMLNALITRSGKKLGLIVTKGFEHTLLEGRTKEAIAGYMLEDVLHMAYREHKEPFIPLRRIRGVTERIDALGRVVIPLYEAETRKAVGELLDEEIEGLVVCLISGYKNPVHETRVGDIAAEVMAARKVKVPVYLAHEINPIIREVSRLNTVIIHAYAAEPARAQLYGIEDKLKAAGYESPLQVALSYGATANIRHPRIYEAAVSGPIGGIIGAQYLGRVIGEPNIVCTDMGGTSFDFGVIHNDEYGLLNEPEFERMYLNLDMVDLNTIGAGAGTYIRLDPYTNRIILGPDSAGGNPGPVCTDMGNETPTTADCNLLLGRLNPDNYLGGRIKLNVEKTHRIFKEKIADRLGISVEQAAEGIVDLMNARMLNKVRESMVGRDFRDYVLLGYGGATGLHLAGYTGDMPWKGVATVPWAAAFSAFGGTCMDYAHRQTASVDLVIPYRSEDAALAALAMQLSASWDRLERQVIDDFAAEGIDAASITVNRFVMMQYNGQLEDIQVPVSVFPIAGPAEVREIVDSYERVYGERFPAVARASEAGYRIRAIGLFASTPTPKPTIPAFPLDDPTPSAEFRKNVRPVYINGEWRETDIWDLDAVRPGNLMPGPAILEGPAYTLLVPPDRVASMDAHRVIWLQAKGA